MPSFTIDPKFLSHEAGIGTDTKEILKSFMEEGWILENTPKSKKFLILGSLRKLRDFSVAHGMPPLRIPQSKSAKFCYMPHVSGAITKPEVPTIWRIHDIFPITNPEWFTKNGVNLFKNTINQINLGQSFFLSNSYHTKNEFMKRFKIKDSDIEVIYCVPKDLTQSQPCQVCTICTTESICPPAVRYLLTVGTIEPRKNLEKLIKSWKKSNLGSRNINLMIVGKFGWKISDKLRTYLETNDDGVTYLGKICDYSLHLVYKESIGYISCSINEGFNIPVEQARYYQLPLVLSNISVHRELYEKYSANFFELDSDRGLANKMLDLVTGNLPKSSAELRTQKHSKALNDALSRWVNF